MFSGVFPTPSVTVSISCIGLDFSFLTLQFIVLIAWASFAGLCVGVKKQDMVSSATSRQFVGAPWCSLGSKRLIAVIGAEVFSGYVSVLTTECSHLCFFFCVISGTGSVLLSTMSCPSCIIIPNLFEYGTWWPLCFVIQQVEPNFHAGSGCSGV